MNTEMLSNEIVLAMSGILNQEQLRQLKDVLSNKLKDVEISKYEIATIDNTNEHFVKLFLSCKMIEGLSKKSVKAYRNELLRFNAYVNTDFSRCTTNHIRAYLADCLNNNISKRTINNYRSYLSAFYKWMASEGYIPNNIVANVKPMKIDKRKSTVLTAEDMEKIKRACINERETSLIDLLESTGMRCSEICEFKLSDIDFNAKTIVIHGKGNKDRIGFFTPRFKISLEKYLLTRGYESDYVFGKSRGNHDKMSSDSVEKAVKKICARAGMPHLVIHKFRHYFCTELCRRGMPIQEVQQLMGHESIETTANIYNHINDSVMGAEFAKYCA